MDETDRRFVGVLMFLGAVAVIVHFQTPWGTAAGVVLWLASLLWIAQARPQTEQTYEAYVKNNTPLEDRYRSNLVRRRD